MQTTVERFRLRRLLVVDGEIRSLVMLAFAVGSGSALLLLGIELLVVLLSLAKVDVFRYLLGSTALSWIAHRTLH